MKKNFLVIFCLFLTLAFQNCAEVGLDAVDMSAHSNFSGKEEPSFKPRAGNREFVAGVFSEIFLPQGKSVDHQTAQDLVGDTEKYLFDFISDLFDKNKDLKIYNIIVNNVLKNVEEFEGICNTIEDDATCATPTNVSGRLVQTKVSNIPSPSVTKEGYRIRTCAQVLQINRAVQNMVYNLTGDQNTKMQDSDIEKVFDFFYPFKGMDQATYSDLVSLKKSLDQEADLESWRGIAFVICKSPGWQIP